MAVVNFCRHLLILSVLLHVSWSFKLRKSDGARLLVQKEVQNTYLVENSDIVIKYQLFNVGLEDAKAIKLVESGLPDRQFDVVAGSMTVSIDSLAPQTNLTHVLVVRPTIAGYYNFTAAACTYKSGANLDTVFTTYSSVPLRSVIIPQKQYDRQFSAHTLDWLIFIALTTPSLFLPLSLWWSTKSKYDLISQTSGLKKD